MTITSLMFLMGLKSLMMTQKHALTILINIEFISLASMLILSLTSLTNNISQFSIMTFLTLIACEGAIGLTIIIILTRTSGNDLFSSSNITN